MDGQELIQQGLLQEQRISRIFFYKEMRSQKPVLTTQNRKTFLYQFLAKYSVNEIQEKANL